MRRRDRIWPASLSPEGRERLPGRELAGTGSPTELAHHDDASAASIPLPGREMERVRE
jgi:hypothetical protein